MGGHVNRNCPVEKKNRHCGLLLFGNSSDVGVLSHESALRMMGQGCALLVKIWRCVWFRSSFQLHVAISPPGATSRRGWVSNLNTPVCMSNCTSCAYILSPFGWHTWIGGTCALHLFWQFLFRFSENNFPFFVCIQPNLIFFQIDKIINPY